MAEGCAGVSATYEREFKGILGGDDKVLASVVKTCSPDEKAAYEATRLRPFLVVRAAGSLGADLVAVRQDVSFLVEVKSTKQDTFYFTDSPRLSEQIEIIRQQCERSGVLPIYAVRRKGVRGDAWRLFTLPGLRLHGAAAELHRRIASMEKTERGNDVLRWERGLPLYKFLAYLCGPNGAVTPRAAVAVSGPP